MKRPRQLYLRVPIDRDTALALIRSLGRITSYRYAAQMFDVTKPTQRQHVSVKWVKGVCDGKIR